MQPLRERLAVKPEDLRRRLDPATLPFQTTAEVAPVKTTIGQPRAAEAIAFALEVGVRGFHIYAAGSPGTGRESTVVAAVRAFAASRPTPPDWVYVHNFAEPDRPRAFSMPAGQGRRLAQVLTSFREAVQQEIPRAFESEGYARRREQSLAEVSARRAKLLSDLSAFALERGLPEGGSSSDIDGRWMNRAAGPCPFQPSKCCFSLAISAGDQSRRPITSSHASM